MGDPADDQVQKVFDRWRRREKRLDDALFQADIRGLAQRCYMAARKDERGRLGSDCEFSRTARRLEVAEALLEETHDELTLLRKEFERRVEDEKCRADQASEDLAKMRAKYDTLARQVRVGVHAGEVVRS